MDSSLQPVTRKKDWFFGHPGGLATLAFTETWVGFSYYGMQSLLVLYMTKQLLLPDHVGNVLFFPPFHAFLNGLYGHRDGAALASAVVGIYSALAYAMPLIGGMIADTWLGRTRTIAFGAALMTLGHFLMAFERSFLLALLCILVGMGCAGTLKAQIGGLYAIDDRRRADAFQIYTLAINIAVIVAPIICGGLGESYHWSWGFAAAGAGMGIGLATYLLGRRSLPPEPPRRKTTGHAHAKLTGADFRKLAVLALLLPILATSAIGNQEIFNGYLLWGEKYYQLVFFGHTMPVSWLLSLDAFISTGCLFATIAFWRWWASRRRDPDEIVKIACGSAINALAPLILGVASLHTAGGHKVGLGWGVAFHLVNDIGFSNVYAIGIALYSRASPPALGATVVNSFVLHIFLANLLVGWLAGFLQTMPASRFWFMHAGLIAIAAALLFVCARVFRATLAPHAPMDQAAAAMR